MAEDKKRELNKAIPDQSTSVVENTKTETGEKTGGFHKRRGREGFSQKSNYDKSRKKEYEKEKDGFETVVLSVRRVSKTTDGGRVLRMSVLVAVGDKNGRIGLGTGKAKETFVAVRKAENSAKKSSIKIPLLRKSTVPHDVFVKFKSTRVLIKKAYDRYGIKTQGAARKIFEIAGVKDVACKCFGNKKSVHNISYGILKGLMSLNSIDSLAERIGKPISSLIKRSRTLT